MINVLMRQIDEMNEWNGRINEWDEWTDDRTILTSSTSLYHLYFL